MLRFAQPVQKQRQIVFVVESINVHLTSKISVIETTVGRSISVAVRNQDEIAWNIRRLRMWSGARKMTDRRDVTLDEHATGLLSVSCKCQREWVFVCTMRDALRLVSREHALIVHPGGRRLGLAKR